MMSLDQLGLWDVICCFGALGIIFRLLKYATSSSPSGIKTTSLRGPPRDSIIFGSKQFLNFSCDAGEAFEKWATEYGPAFKVPGGFGLYKIMIIDPKANAHFYSKETFGYVQSKFSRMFIENLLGRGLLWAEGESHRRQRKTLSPAFSNAAIRKLISVFYDSSYKVKTHWDTILASDGGNDVIIDVEKWMSHISLDSIGIAGFGHDFGSLDGKSCAISDLFQSAASTEPSRVSKFIFLLSAVVPILLKVPTGENRLFRTLRLTMSEIAEELLDRSRREKGGMIVGETHAEEKSIMGLLIKADNELQMSNEEIVAQNVLLIAGYETTSVSLTWALIELAREPKKQARLREEITQLSGTDPTWEQLASALPYLDSVVQETLRLHPPIVETTRVAAEDDVIPFSAPVTTSSGEVVTSIIVKKGTIVCSPIHTMNRSEAFWGPNAKEFIPERWLEDGQTSVKDMPGPRHILSFSDGPRLCLGRSFALAEFKAALSVLIRYYTFELPDGPETKFEMHGSIVKRPRAVSTDGHKMLMKVRRVE